MYGDLGVVVYEPHGRKAGHAEGCAGCVSLGLDTDLAPGEAGEHIHDLPSLRLPERREREVLVLKEFEGLKYREIAKLLGIPIGTVMSRLYSARKHLAAAIEEQS